MKPPSGGIPAIDSAATAEMKKVSGIIAPSPDSLRIDRVWAAWSTMPAAMNSAALNVACATMWNIAATTAPWVPNPSSMAMRPRWLTVE